MMLWPKTIFLGVKKIRGKTMGHIMITQTKKDTVIKEQQIRISIRINPHHTHNKIITEIIVIISNTLKLMMSTQDTPIRRLVRVRPSKPSTRSKIRIPIRVKKLQDKLPGNSHLGICTNSLQDSSRGNNPWDRLLEISTNLNLHDNNRGNLQNNSLGKKCNIITRRNKRALSRWIVKIEQK